MTDETIGNVPILILGNKIDRPEAISEEKMREMFGLYGQTTGKVSRGHLSVGTRTTATQWHTLVCDPSSENSALLSHSGVFTLDI